MKAPHRDPGLDMLLELHDLTLFADEIGHWVKFVVRRTDVTAERPHGARLVGFDNAHPIREKRGP